MSTHRVDVVRINEIEKHPNADSLGLVHIEGFTAIVRLGDFKPGDLAVYIEPDYVVPDDDRFAFLQGKTRIKTRRLRGVWSQGLLIPAPADVAEGDDVMERFGIVRYEPPVRPVRGRGGPGSPLGNADLATDVPRELAALPVYDLENWRKHRRVFVPGEPVVITEKIHGSNARYCWTDGAMWVGSRTRWIQSGETEERTANVWWRALRSCPWIADFCRAYPGHVLYGEVFGAVQDLRYGAVGDQVFFRAFDVMRDGQFVDAVEFYTLLPDDIHTVPMLFTGAYDQDATEELSRRPTSTLAAHVSEGIVIKPLRERTDPRIGRVALKLVSDLYLERA